MPYLNNLVNRMKLYECPKCGNRVVTGNNSDDADVSILCVANFRHYTSVVMNVVKKSDNLIELLNE